MGGIDLMSQPKSAYQLDRRSKFRFYFRFFFNLFNVALVNSFIVYKKFENKDLIWYAWHRNWSLLSSAQNYFVLIIVHPSTPKLKDLSWYPYHICQFSWKQGNTVSSQIGKENRIFVTYPLCDVGLRLQKERNCFLQYHS